MSANTSYREESLALVRRAIAALDDKKATDIRIFEVADVSSVTDFVIVATGTSDPHLRAIGNEIDKTLDEAKIKIVGIESQPESGWTVVDAFHVMVHIFRPDQRANFQIEKLWKDAKELPLKQFLSTVAAPVSAQAVSVTGKIKAAETVAKPVKAAKAAKPAKKAPTKKADKIVVRKSVVKRTAAEKSKPEFVKEPNKKRTIKVAAKIAAKVKAKQKPLPKGTKKKTVAAEAAKVASAAKKKPAVKPMKPAVKKIVQKKAAKVAKAVRSIAKQKAGVVTRKAKPLR